MKLPFASIALSLFTLSVPAQPTPANPWIGLWQAPLDGRLPSVILTLADDSGQLGGAVVFDMTANDGGQTRVIGHDTHVLMNPHVEGDTLHFQVMRHHDKLDVAVHMTADGKATLRCTNCGNDAPEFQITRER